MEAKVESTFFQKLKNGLTKTRKSIVDKIDSAAFSFRKIDDNLFDEIEEILISSDIGVSTTMIIMNRLREMIKAEKEDDPKAIHRLLKKIISVIMVDENAVKITDGRKKAIIVIGVNGVGKTTSIGKMAHELKKSGQNVLLAAADTYRAAAIEQLEIWAERADVPIIRSIHGTDPAAVVFDAATAAKARGIDILICDTAGRLQNKKNLMNELEKMHRVLTKELPEYKIETLLVLDATTGQNGIAQAKIFNETCGIDGIILTKLDGTAKGGVVIAIKDSLNIPVKYIGVGEQIDDMHKFEAKDFVEALFGN
jgi:fused signal recognition particle receptor